MAFLILTLSVEVSEKMPSVFKEMCRPLNSNSAQYCESHTYHHLGARADTHDGKDGREKEAKGGFSRRERKDRITMQLRIVAEERNYRK